MADGKDLQDEARRRELEAIGQATSKLGHDFNNVLATVRGGIDLIKSRMEKLFPAANPLERQIKILESAVLKGVLLTDKMRSFVRPGELEVEPVRLRSCLDVVVEALRDCGPLPVDIEINVIDDCEVNASEFAVIHMLLDLSVNAIEAMEKIEERYIVYHLEKVMGEQVGGEALPDGSYLRLSIVDHGVGISTELKDKIFEPFFSTKPDGIGTGMGLSITNAREIMRKHGGYLAIVSRPDCGTAVHLYFPVARPVRADSAGSCVDFKR